jgi:hypothetical protein
VPVLRQYFAPERVQVMEMTRGVFQDVADREPTAVGGR